MVAVHLHQPLAERFGAVHEFQVRSPREAIAALDANYPGFLAAFMELRHHWIIVDGDLRGGPSKDQAELAATAPASKEIHFVPAVEGNAFLGAALVGAVLGIASTTLTAQLLGTLLVVGVLTGLSMLFKKKVPTQKDDEDSKLQSYAFSGPENVTAQGATVPLVYGVAYCGTVVVSAGLELGTDLMPTIPPPPPPVAASYPVNSHGVSTPAAGWPPIIAQLVRVMVPSSHGQPNYTYVTKYGPQGYYYAGQVYVTTSAGGSFHSTVDYWHGPLIPASDLVWYTSGAFRFYGYDRINGFTVFDQTRVV